MSIPIAIFSVYYSIFALKWQILPSDFVVLFHLYSIVVFTEIHTDFCC